MRRALFPVVGWILSAVLLQLSSPPASAHTPPIDQVGHHIQLVLYADQLLVDYAIVFSEVAYYRTLSRMNVDGEGEASEQEKVTYHSNQHQQLLRALELTVDGQPTSLTTQQVDDSSPRTFSYLFAANIPRTDDGLHEIRIYNQHPIGRGEIMEYWLQADYDIEVRDSERWEKEGDSASNARGERGVTVAYTVTESRTASGVINPKQTGQRLGAEQPSQNKLRQLLQTKQLSPQLVLIGLLTAMVLGALHALTPGHGKTVVAAYLVGSKGRVWDAVLLGLVVTFTHTFSVILLGLIALYASQYVLPQELFPLLGLFSGMLIILIGTWLLIRRIQAAGHPHNHAPHTHAHGSAHSHAHSHSHAPVEKATLGSILSLGVAGGLVPCPDAIIVLLIAVAVNRVVLGLVVLLAFSVGLAAILVMIGILIVLAKPFLDRLTGTGKWMTRLPILSAVVVIILGVAIAIHALISGGIITVNL